MLIAIHSLYTCLLQHLVYTHAYRNTCASRLRLTSPFSALHKLRLCTSSVCIVFFKKLPQNVYKSTYTLPCRVVMSCSLSFFLFLFYCSTIVGSAWSFGFFIPATTANDLRLRRISIPDLIYYIFTYLITSLV